MDRIRYRTAVFLAQTGLVPRHRRKTTDLTVISNADADTLGTLGLQPGLRICYQVCATLFSAIFRKNIKGIDFTITIFHGSNAIANEFRAVTDNKYTHFVPALQQFQPVGKGK